MPSMASDVRALQSPWLMQAICKVSAFLSLNISAAVLQCPSFKNIGVNATCTGPLLLTINF